MLGQYELAIKPQADNQQQESGMQADYQPVSQGQQQPEQPQFAEQAAEDQESDATSMLNELGSWDRILNSCASARQTAVDGIYNNLTQRTEIIESQAPEGGVAPKPKAPPDPLRAMISKKVHSTCLGGHGYKKFSSVLDDLHGRLEIDKPRDESKDDLLKQLEAIEPESVFVGNQLLDELDKIENKYF